MQLMDYNHRELLVVLMEDIHDYHRVIRDVMIVVELLIVENYLNPHHHHKVKHQCLLDFQVRYNHYQDQLMEMLDLILHELEMLMKVLEEVHLKVYLVMIQLVEEEFLKLKNKNDIR
jgi:hypothetical protein